MPSNYTAVLIVLGAIVILAVGYMLIKKLVNKQVLSIKPQI